ncbi:Uncharacterised protein [Mycobacteroides abscessus subsp. abscessus]|nr:Uncharacterised protein [Mycobacteroides abscessus subsp. abscessus]
MCRGFPPRSPTGPGTSNRVSASPGLLPLDRGGVIVGRGPHGQQLLGVLVLPGQLVRDVRDPLAQRLRVDPVLPVVRLLDLPASVGLVDRGAHRVGDLVRVHDHLPGHVAGRPPDRLDQRRRRAQEALLVRIQDHHQGDLRQIQALAQQVDAHQHVELPEPQGPQQLHPLQGVHIRVQVLHLDPVLHQVVGEVLGHALGQGRDQHALIPVGAPGDLLQQVIDLVLGGLDGHLRVHQAGRADDLLHVPVRLGQLVLARRGGHVDGLPDPLQELVPLQRPVIQGRGQPEAVLHQGALAGHIALVHPADLRHRHVGLVDDQQEVIREVIQQAVRCGAGRAPVDVPGVVLDPGGEAHLLHHLDVVSGAHPQPLGLHELVLVLQLLQPLGQLVLDAVDGFGHALRTGHIVAGGEHVHLRLLPDHLSGQRVQGMDGFDLIPEELDADRVLLVHRDDLHGVPAHPEGPAVEVHVIAGVLHVHELAQQGIPVDLLPLPQSHHLPHVFLGRTQAVDAGDGGDHDDVAPGQQLVGQLRGQRLVLHQHQGGPLHGFDQPRGGGGFAGAGGTEQDDVLLAAFHPLGELFYGLRLVTGRLVLGDDLEGRDDAMDLLRKTHTPSLRRIAQVFDELRCEPTGRAVITLPA